MATPLRAGDPAPDFEGITTDGKHVALKDYRGRKLVLYFYPMDDTPGCTKQACSLRDGNAELAARGAAILGVSTQGEQSHQAFTKKYNLNFPLLADTDGAVGRAYGTLGGDGIVSQAEVGGGNGRSRNLRDRREGQDRPRHRQAQRLQPRAGSAVPHPRMPLHAATVFLSAFLLFLVQPLLAKQILPWFGGAAIVWTLCMVFFQLVLLLGYAYAHWLASRTRGARQAVDPRRAPAAREPRLPAGRRPTPRGSPPAATTPCGESSAFSSRPWACPTSCSSSTSPLVQSWYARAFPGASPYRLFALSNFASMLALLGYPFLVRAVVHELAPVVLVVGGYAALRGLLRRRSPGEAAHLPRARSRRRPARAKSRMSRAPRAREIALWLALSTMGSVTLLARLQPPHAEHLRPSRCCGWCRSPSTCSRSSSASRGAHWYRRDVYLGQPRVDALRDGLVPRRQGASSSSCAGRSPVFTVGLFFVCMFCHGELARRRPGPRHLTLFYLVVSLGGVIGGVLVGIVAPVTLPGYLELEIALVVDRRARPRRHPARAPADRADPAPRRGRVHRRARSSGASTTSPRTPSTSSATTTACCA